ncbi:MAG: peptidylprolyl isomerase [Flavobacteriales bacterium]
MNGILVLVALGLAVLSGNLKNDSKKDKQQIVMEVGPERVPLSEFESTFRKNNADRVVDKEYLDQYTDLFVDFKRKVLFAKELKMDTSVAFKRELAGYRRQLARPYLTDKKAEESLIDEAYSRMLEEVRASHILITLDESALPDDTLKAYNRLMQLRSAALAGQDFNKLAKINSQDPSAKENSGDLGYFSAFRMLYDFETVAYNTEVGEISLPFRTRVGYHIVKVTDRRKNKGELKVAHIMIEEREDATPKEVIANQEKIVQMKEAFASGKSFEDMVRFSDDKSSVKNRGELPWFSSGQMVAPFENAAFGLQKPGDISEPVKTIYGWHFIKLLDTKAVPSFEDSKADIQRKINRDSRTNVGRESLIKNIKKEYKFRQISSGSSFAKNLQVFYDIDLQNWDRKNFETDNKTLFVLDNINYTQNDFADYLNKHKSKIDPNKMESSINSLYNNWIDDSCIKHEDSQLEDKYPEFRALMKEYNDGIMLFDLMDKKVWSKAIEDTVGLMNYYQIAKENYVWGENVVASTFNCKNQKTADRLRSLINNRYSLNQLTKKEIDLLRFGKGDGIFLSDQDIVNIINYTNPSSISFEKKNYSKGTSNTIDNKWSLGLTEDDPQLDGTILISNITDIKSGEIKTFDEAKGAVISDYQDYLESMWKKELEQKYPVIIYEDVLYSIIQK